MTDWDSNGHVTSSHVTQKVNVMTPNIFGAHYLENGWRYGLGVEPLGAAISRLKPP